MIVANGIVDRSFGCLSISIILPSVSSSYMGSIGPRRRQGILELYQISQGCTYWLVIS